MTTQEQYAVMQTTLDERQWRVFLATEALKTGVGGISRVGRLSGADRKTVRRGILELREPPLLGRVRRVGGGRKKLTETDLTLIADLELLVEPKGDPMSLTQWTTKSLATLVSALAKKRHVIKKSALAEVLSSLGFSLQGKQEKH
jgi:transposase